MLSYEIWEIWRIQFYLSLSLIPVPIFIQLTDVIKIKEHLYYVLLKIDKRILEYDDKDVIEEFYMELYYLVQ